MKKDIACMYKKEKKKKKKASFCYQQEIRGTGVSLGKIKRGEGAW
jgi:hypothetical protein